MSAFVVNKRHIDALVTGALEAGECGWGPFSWYHQGNPRAVLEVGESADAFGRMLWAENVRSVQARYPDTVEGGNYPGSIDFTPADVDAYTFEPLAEPLPMIAVLKAIACLRYQSCEHAGWKSSEAYTVLDALERAAVTSLPGYDEAPWEVPHDLPVKALYDTRQHI